jgi:hypothetical protein
MKDALSIIVSSRTRLAAALALIVVLIAGGVTLGSWAVGSDPGNGYAKAVSGTNLTLSDASASTTGQLYPGGTGDVKVTVHNPNPFGVTITSVAGTGGPVTSDQAGCNAASVTYTDQSSLSLSLGAGATQTFTLTGAAAMSSSANQSCEGAVFAIPVTLAATT